MTKTCTKCDTEKPLIFFHKRKASKSGTSPKCKTCVKLYTYDYNETNRAKIRTTNNSYYQRNKEFIKKSIGKRASIRRKMDEFYKFKINLRTLIRNSIKKKGFSKSSKTASILGCSFEELHRHLMNTFETNYGLPFSQIDTALLHIDHIIPLATAKTEEEVLKLNHYSNLQYLFEEDNLEKGDKLDWRIDYV